MKWIVILKYTIVFLSFMSFCLNIGIIICLYLYYKRRREDIISVILSSKRLETKIDCIVSSNKLDTDKFKREVIDEIRYLQQLDEEEKLATQSNVESSITQTQLENVVYKIYYATATSESNKDAFYRVTELPESDSIFKLTEVQKGGCEFEVYDGAISTVLKEKEYLINSCLVTKIGNSKVVVLEKGFAEQNAEGKWIITKQAKIKIE